MGVTNLTCDLGDRHFLKFGLKPCTFGDGHGRSPFARPTVDGDELRKTEGYCFFSLKPVLSATMR
ncbi:MAG: hypothetical protein WBA57_02020 [Elainellaceae cyanobacterium]